MTNCTGCGHTRKVHIVHEKTLEGYCSAPDCACTKFDKVEMIEEWGEDWLDETDW